MDWIDIYLWIVTISFICYLAFNFDKRLKALEMSVNTLEYKIKKIEK